MLNFIQRATMRALFHASALTERARFDTLTCALEGACMHLALQHDEDTMWALCARDYQRELAGRYGDEGDWTLAVTDAPKPKPKRKRKAGAVKAPSVRKART